MSIFDHRQRLMAFQACKTLSHARSLALPNNVCVLCYVVRMCLRLAWTSTINVSIFRRMHKNKHELNEVGFLFLSLTVKYLTNRKIHTTDGALWKRCAFFLNQIDSKNYKKNWLKFSLNFFFFFIFALLIYKSRFIIQWFSSTMLSCDSMF